MHDRQQCGGRHRQAHFRGDGRERVREPRAGHAASDGSAAGSVGPAMSETRYSPRAKSTVGPLGASLSCVITDRASGASCARTRGPSSLGSDRSRRPCRKPPSRSRAPSASGLRSSTRPRTRAAAHTNAICPSAPLRTILLCLFADEVEFFLACRAVVGPRRPAPRLYSATLAHL